MMHYLAFLFTALLLISGSGMYAQEKVEPWSEKQLMTTETLASRIEQGKSGNLLILSVGPDAIIKGAIDIGPTMEEGHLDRLEAYLKGVPKDKEVVVFCGCCPFDRCPNIRPAFTKLNQLGFKNGKLLDIPQNIKVNWLDKGYPMND